MKKASVLLSILRVPFLGFSTLIFSSLALAAPTKITWHGHAAFQITTPKNLEIWIDPWLTNPLNPNAKNGKDPLSGIAKANYILITHGHSDHVGDSVELARKTQAKLIANYELAHNLIHVH